MRDGVICLLPYSAFVDRKVAHLDPGHSLIEPVRLFIYTHRERFYHKRSRLSLHSSLDCISAVSVVYSPNRILDDARASPTTYS